MMEHYGIIYLDDEDPNYYLSWDNREPFVVSDFETAARRASIIEGRPVRVVEMHQTFAGWAHCP